MKNTGGIITSLEGNCIIENTLFTYSEEEKEENSLNKLNASLVLTPKFIPVYTGMLKDLSLLEGVIYGFIDFFLDNNEKFYCTNEQIANMLNISETSVSNAMASLKQKGLINITYKIRTGGGKTRFVRLTKSVSPTYKICESDLQNLAYIENKIIDNKLIERKEIYKEKKSIPSVSELVEAYKQDAKLADKINDAEVVKEWAEYKQAKKDRAYKTIKGFLQQLVVNVNKVSNGEIRYDVNLRLRFALNQTIEKERKDIYWNDNIEREYQGWKKIYLLEQNGNE